MSESTAKILYLALDRQRLQNFIDSAMSCSLELLDAAMRIKAEIPNLGLADNHRAAITKLCESFANSKHDIANELSDLPHKHSFNFHGAMTSVELIVGWILDDMRMLRAVTTGIEADGAGLAYVLLCETGVPLLDAFVRVREFGETYKAAIRALLK